VRRVPDVARRLKWAAGVPGAVVVTGRDLRTGLVAHWRFDEGKGRRTFDSSGNGHTGHLEGCRWAKGRFGSALAFDRLSDGVVVSESDAFRLTGEITMAAWINMSQATPLGRIAGTVGPRNGYRLRVGSGMVDFGIVGASGKEVVSARAPGGTRISPGRWYHVAATYSDESNLIRMYLNGRLDRTFTTQISMAPISGLFVIGRGTTPDPEHCTVKWPGLIDELRLYDRVLSAREIWRLAKPRSRARRQKGSRPGGEALK
jgi:hypothetical protein